MWDTDKLASTLQIVLITGHNSFWFVWPHDQEKIVTNVDVAKNKSYKLSVSSRIADFVSGNKTFDFSKFFKNVPFPNDKILAWISGSFQDILKIKIVPCDQCINIPFSLVSNATSFVSIRLQNKSYVHSREGCQINFSAKCPVWNGRSVLQAIDWLL